MGHDYKGDFNADDRILQAMALNDRYATRATGRLQCVTPTQPGGIKLTRVKPAARYVLKAGFVENALVN